MWDTVRDTAAQDTAAQDTAAQDTAARDTAARDNAARETAARDRCAGPAAREAWGQHALGVASPQEKVVFPTWSATSCNEQ